MKTKFKVGDKVECTNLKCHEGNKPWAEKDNFKIGHVYTVKKINGYGWLEFNEKKFSIPPGNFKLSQCVTKTTELNTWQQEFPHLRSYIKDVMRAS